MFLHNFHPQAVAFSIGPVSVYWYGIGYVTAILFGLWLITVLGKRRGNGMDPIATLQDDKRKKIQDDKNNQSGNAYSAEKIFDVGFWVVIGGLIGARLWYVITVQPGFFWQAPLEIFKIWHGGMAIHGAIIGGALALYIKLLLDCAALRSKNNTLHNFFQWADLFAPALVIGQGIGRWGNYFNQELYGWPTNSRWGIPIDPANRVAGFESFEYFQPVFLYESVLDIGLGVLLIVGLMGRIKKGTVFALYLIGYGVIRFLISFLRVEPVPMLWGLQAHQWTAVGMVMAGAVVFSLVLRGNNKLKNINNNA